MVPEQWLTVQSVIIVSSESADPLVAKAIRLFCARVNERSRVALTVISPADIERVTCDNATILVAGCGNNHPLLVEYRRLLDLPAPAGPEGYTLVSRAESRGALIVIDGADAHGVLYGMGRLLHLLRFEADTLALPVLQEQQTPVIGNRGIYFASHFNNYYENAPLDALDHYIEELALWGCNVLMYWFDMNWFPYGFWEDPASAGMKMAARLRHLAATAHACGMRVASGGVANEAFRDHASAELRADNRARRGGFYESQVCPSQPGGMAMILEDRRRALELQGPIDIFTYWPYDQGGCGCEACSDAEHRWGHTFLAIGPQIVQVVKELNPDVHVNVATWLMDDVERAQVYALCREGADWFDGVMTETQHAGEEALAARYSRWVFPEISMIDCYFTSYGLNGANPLPVHFADEARRMALAGCGTALYSEGIYEDINKVVWMNVLWDPTRTARDIVEEYCGYYFGDQTRGEMSELMMELETTWGAAKLAKTPSETTERILARLNAIAPRLPAPAWCRDRWQMLRDRAELDALMTRIGSDVEVIREARHLFELAGYPQDSTFRERVMRFCVTLAQRQTLIEQLYAKHWQYLCHFHTERTQMIFLPDEVIGKHNWQPLEECLRATFSIADDDAFRMAIVKSTRRWFWFNGIDFRFLFV